tara:strand:- start:570 stop:851 length:282 start_codon:yes stop_codon:yes gene_type:complete
MIYYSGIGCKKNEIHTEQEFLDIMKTYFMWKDWNKEVSWSAQLQFKDWVLPDDFIFFTLDDWIEYSGASVLTEVELSKKVTQKVGEVVATANV